MERKKFQSAAGRDAKSKKIYSIFQYYIIRNDELWQHIEPGADQKGERRELEVPHFV